MGKAIRNTNKESPKVPHTVQLPTQQKLEFLANLIVDKILEDQNNGQKLLKQIEEAYAARPTTSA